MGTWVTEMAEAHGNEAQRRADDFAKRLAGGKCLPSGKAPPNAGAVPPELTTGAVPKRPEDKARHAQSLVQELGRTLGPQRGDKVRKGKGGKKS